MGASEAPGPLKGISVRIPIGTVTAVTGVAGAGKSSLALDVLYAEGHRRYAETFSPYARQFLERLDRPRAERVEGVLHGVVVPIEDARLHAEDAVGRRSAARGARATALGGSLTSTLYVLDEPSVGLPADPRRARGRWRCPTDCCPWCQSR